ncbi:MAG: ComEA family DNA-binding protein, partial [Thermoanaerobaculia bacterium]
AAAAALVLPGWLSAPPAASPALSGVPAAPRRIDLNRSSWYEWTLLEGVGESRARRIVGARAARGGFRSIADLEEIPGMPRGWTEKIRQHLSLEDDER